MTMCIIFLYTLSIFSTIHAAQQAGPGTSLWFLVNQTQEVVHDATALVDSLAQTILDINTKEDVLASLVDYVAQESARKIDLVFDQAEEIRVTADSKLDDVINYLQYVATESARRIDLVLSKANEIDDNAASHLDAIRQDTEILELLVNKISSEIAQVEDDLTTITNNQVNILSTLDIVRHNGELAVQTMTQNNFMLNSKIDAVSSHLDLYYTELNDNDAKVFSALDKVDTKLIIGIKSIHEQFNAHNIDNNNAKIPHKNLSIYQNDINQNGFEITQPGYYILGEAITIFAETGIYIQAENVVLDLNGQTLVVENDTTRILLVDQSQNIIIKNGSLIGGQGLLVSNSNEINIENLHVADSTTTSIELQNSSKFSVTSCTIHNGAQHGIEIDANTATGIITNTVITDCAQIGVVCKGTRISIEDSVIQHNGVHGISIENSYNIHLQRNSADANSMHGIYLDANSKLIHIESCRVMGNSGIGCIDESATQAMWINKLSSGNTGENYSGIRAVSLSKATSYWHNVYGN